MSWNCPVCHTEGNNDAAMKCMNCDKQFDEQELAAAKVQDQLAAIESGAASGAAGKAAVLLSQGSSLAEATLALVQDGIAPDAAGRIVNEVYTWRSQSQMAAARKMMISGALLCAVGIAVTVVTYITGFHVVVVVGGLIIAGAFQFIRGLRQYTH